MNNEEKILDKLDGLERGLGEVNGRLTGLEGRFDGLETRFDGLETRFDGLETRFDGLETRFDGLETRFDGLETRFEGRFNGLESKFSGFETKFEGLEGNQDFLAIELKRFSDTQDRLVATVADLDHYARNELATKQELHEVESRLTGHLDGLSQRNKIHDSEICALDARVSRIEGRPFQA